MNQEILSGILKPLVSALVAYLAAKQILFDSNTWNIIITSLVAAAMAAWGGYQKTEKNLVKSVDALAQDPNSSVKAVILAPTVAGRKLETEIPGNTTVLAGTAAARSASESGSPAAGDFL